MRVLSVTSEAAPLVKTGGLADVAGALPAALAGHGVAMRTLLPGYPAVMAALGAQGRAVAVLRDCFGGPARLVAGQAGGLDLIALDAPHLFARGAGPYTSDTGRDWPDNPQRFAALSWAAAEIAAGALADWQPQILHAHDWQAGLAPYFMAKMPAAAAVRSVLTIHNIAFQGLAGADQLAALRIDRADFTPDKLEYYGRFSALKAGLVMADALTTVSPTYAAELLTAEFGMGLDGVLRARQADFSGILNGIDLNLWSPATDRHITPFTTPAGKAANKQALRAAFGLGPAKGPLCVVISRLTDQKGLDLLLTALPALLAQGGQLALLGSGDPALETAYLQAARDHADVAVRVGYDEPLSHLMMAGGDMILVPSRFEPCGLTQLYGLRYGTVPLVALTGGLADTVVPANPASLAGKVVATGLQFYPVTAAALAQAITRACALYAQTPLWRRIMRNAMAQPVGWDHSAAAYAALYKGLSGQKT